MNNIIKDKNQILMDSEFISMNLLSLRKLMDKQKITMQEAIAKMQEKPKIVTYDFVVANQDKIAKLMQE